MGKRIYEAVANLPEELITPEIAAAAIEEGNIQLLDCLPHKYLTGEVVVSVIEKNSNSYSYYGFKLSSLPEEIRTKEVCEFAVGKDESNILSVPDELRSGTMLLKLLNRSKQNIKYLHLFPAEVWTEELALFGVKNIYSETVSNYGRRGGYHGSSTNTDVKRVQIFLSYVPNTIKTKQFYLNLSRLNMNLDDIDILIPDRYKKTAYYMNLAIKDFNRVPRNFYNYGMFMVAIENKKISFDEPYFYGSTSAIQRKVETENHKQLMDAIFAVMDDAMADKVIEARPDDFKKLPKKFQTPERLISSIEKDGREVVLIGRDTQPGLFTIEVCQAYIRKNCKIPKLPETIWTDDFVKY